MCGTAQNGKRETGTLVSVRKTDLHIEACDYHSDQSEQLISGIEVRGLTKEFSANAVRAVDDVTFDAAPGEVVGLLGANGAGKTTMVKMLCTLLRPTSGTVCVGGCDTVSDSRAVRARMGVLFGSDTGLYERLSARENLRYFAALNGIDPRNYELRLNELADLFGLHRFIDQLVTTYSSGMKQRTALARSVVHDPPFLILDEPTTALDIDTTLVVHAFVSRCRDEGKTVILSSHDTIELERLCDRVLTIDAGRIVDEAQRGRDFGGDSGSLRSRYLEIKSVAQ